MTVLQMLKGLNPTPYNFSHHKYLDIGPPACQSLSEAAADIYDSDDFRMYAFKITRCTRNRSHDWTECPFAHRGEKARRRDPRKFSYAAVACPEFRNGECKKGEACEFAHGVFEYWLHPARYRTRACNSGRFCQRKVCFFAHSPEQLRSETKYKCHYMYRVRSEGGSTSKVSGGLKRAALAPVPETAGEDLDFLGRLRSLKIRGAEGEEGDCFEFSDMDLPHVGWISELVE